MTCAHCAEFHCHPTFWRINECRESLLFDVYGPSELPAGLADGRPVTVSVSVTADHSTGSEQVMIQYGSILQIRGCQI